MQYRYQKPLEDIYNEYLEKYQKTASRPYPDKLLALLLLQEKDNYEPEHLSNGSFYKKYKKEIDEKINKVIIDFNITKEDIINYIEQRGICYSEEEYEYLKTWFVFASGFTTVIGTQRWHPSYTPEEAYEKSYNCFYGQYRKENTNTRERTIKRYKEKVRRKYGHKHN